MCYLKIVRLYVMKRKENRILFHLLLLKATTAYQFNKALAGHVCMHQHIYDS